MKLCLILLCMLGLLVKENVPINPILLRIGLVFAVLGAVVYEIVKGVLAVTNHFWKFLPNAEDDKKVCGKKYQELQHQLDSIIAENNLLRELLEEKNLKQLNQNEVIVEESFFAL